MAELKLLYPYVIRALTVMCGSGFDTKTVVDANGLLHTMESHDFIAAFVICERMLGYTKVLSQQLQGERVCDLTGFHCYAILCTGSTKDVYSAHQNIEEVKTVLKDVRVEEAVYDKLWETMVQLAGEELSPPRLASRQTLRANHPHDSAKEYYKRAFLPYVDHLLEDLNRRFQTSPMLSKGMAI